MAPERPPVAAVQWMPPAFNTGVLRVIAGEWGVPPIFVATLRRRGPVVKFYGAMGEMPAGLRREICRCLVSHGIRRAIYERYHNGVRKPYRIDYVGNSQTTSRPRSRAGDTLRDALGPDAGPVGR